MISFFFGAGASKCLGMPDMGELYDELKRRCETDTQKAIMKSYVSQGVESLYTDIIQACDMQNNKIITKMHYVSGDISTSYEKLREEMKQLQAILRDILLDKLEPNDNLESYQDMLHSIGIGPSPSDIVTTNYDLVLDTIFEHEIVDGFVKDDYKKGLYSWDDDWQRGPHDTRVVKLHGSINWQYSRDKNGRQRWFDKHPYTNIEKLPRPGRRPKDRDVMLLPVLHHKNYERRPFEALFRQFQKILGGTDLLVAIGYSFNDKPINDEIKKRLGTTLSLLSVTPEAWQETLDAFRENTDSSKTPVQILVCDGVPYAQSEPNSYSLYTYNSGFGVGTVDKIRLVIDAVQAHKEGTKQLQVKYMNKKERKRCR